MNLYLLTLAGGICLLLVGINSKAQTGKLTIEATHFESNKGVAIVHLFREQDAIHRKPFLQATAGIIDGEAKIVFNTIPYGDYAAIIFQDENSNGILDLKFGFPNEPMGFSNEWKLSLFSGMPNFRKLKFRFDQVNLKYTIMIR
jgi:uncharacterized protein (DUF2141 family)